MLPLLNSTETVRKEVGQQISRKHKSELGQFMTPATIARFMAALFAPSTLHTAKLLDAGAGIGSLCGAFIDRWAAGGFDFQNVHIDAYEIDSKLCSHLTETLTEYEKQLDLSVLILAEDFIEEAVRAIQERRQCFTHAILNPPYRKINSTSRHRFLLREVGIETVNLYSAFLALTIELMQSGGQIVAIIPRSFCNGPYYRSLRELIVAKTAIRHIHLFAARNRAFKYDDVLQENVIIVLERDAVQENVVISTSTDDRFSDIETHTHPFNRIIFPNDSERFIHVQTSTEHNEIELSLVISCSLKEIEIEVSTGPVVDFRVKPHARKMPENGSVPLLYPNHFSGNCIDWPKLNFKKPNAIMRNKETEKWLYPSGFYVVVRRFSSKEEKRRIMASVVYPDAFDYPALGFENHLNVLHFGKQGIPEEIAKGLAVYLNCSAVDEQFRRFSGHTQVNATDLRLLKYPDRETLKQIGIWAKAQKHLTQEKIDRKIESIAWPKIATTSKTR
jgi:adenine-specific DNA-methyltransferase